MWKEIQGGINITFRRGVAGRTVYVTASETLTPGGRVQPNGTDESFHFDSWTLADGAQTAVQHEYIEARFWQVMGAPEPPSESVGPGRPGAVKHH